MSSNQTVFVSSGEMFPTRVMTTGCGDSFNAIFIYGVIQDEGFINSMMYGVAFGGANIYSGFPEKVQISVINERMKYISYAMILPKMPICLLSKEAVWVIPAPT